MTPLRKAAMIPNPGSGRKQVRVTLPSIPQFQPGEQVEIKIHIYGAKLVAKGWVIDFPSEGTARVGYFVQLPPADSLTFQWADYPKSGLLDGVVQLPLDHLRPMRAKQLNLLDADAPVVREYGQIDDQIALLPLRQQRILARRILRRLSDAAKKLEFIATDDIDVNQPENRRHRPSGWLDTSSEEDGAKFRLRWNKSDGKRGCITLKTKAQVVLVQGMQDARQPVRNIIKALNLFGSDSDIIELLYSKNCLTEAAYGRLIDLLSE